MDFPIKNGDFPWQNVSSPEGNVGDFQHHHSKSFWIVIKLSQVFTFVTCILSAMSLWQYQCYWYHSQLTMLLGREWISWVQCAWHKSILQLERINSEKTEENAEINHGDMSFLYPMTDPWCCYIWCAMDPINIPPLMLALIYQHQPDPSWLLQSVESPRSDPSDTFPNRSRLVSCFTLPLTSFDIIWHHLTPSVKR